MLLALRSSGDAECRVLYCPWHTASADVVMTLITAEVDSLTDGSSHMLAATT